MLSRPKPRPVELRQRLLAHSTDHRQMERQSYVYMLASARYGTLYTGVTADLIRRVWQHREEWAAGFTKEYGVKRLVWYEIHTDIRCAITREKQIKKWKRVWKIELIQEQNPYWRDLYDDIVF